MRRTALILLLALPLAAQSHLNVAPGKFVKIAFTHVAGDTANVFSYMVQFLNDGSGSSSFNIPAGQAFVMTDISVESQVPLGYTGSLDGNVSLHWYANGQQNLAMLYSESFRALGSNEACGFSRSFTAGHLFAASGTSRPSFFVSTPWDAAHNSLRITTSGYLINYP